VHAPHYDVCVGVTPLCTLSWGVAAGSLHPDSEGLLRHFQKIIKLNQQQNQKQTRIIEEPTKKVDVVCKQCGRTYHSASGRTTVCPRCRKYRGVNSKVRGAVPCSSDGDRWHVVGCYLAGRGRGTTRPVGARGSGATRTMGGNPTAARCSENCRWQ
jgi:hypothetical protein